MATRWLLSFVYLLASVVVAQEYSYSDDDLLDATLTKTVTETVTRYLSQCGDITPTPVEIPGTTLLGTTTFTSTLQSTVSIVIPAGVTNVSAIAPTGLIPPQSVLNLTSLTTPSVAGTGIHSGFSYSTPFANTTKMPCSTATVIVPVSLSTSSHSGTPSTPAPATSSVASTNGSPTEVPISESSKLENDTALQLLLGVASIVCMSVAGFL